MVEDLDMVDRSHPDLRVVALWDVCGVKRSEANTKTCEYANRERLRFFERPIKSSPRGAQGTYAGEPYYC